MIKKPLVFTSMAVGMLLLAFLAPRNANHLEADYTTTTTAQNAQTPCMHAVYYPTQSQATMPPPMAAYNQPQSTTTQNDSAASATGSYNIGPNNDPTFAQRQFDAYYQTMYPNYRQYDVSPTQNQYTTANGYGYVTSNPASENDPQFAQKQFDSYYSQLYPRFYTNSYGWQ